MSQRTFIVTFASLIFGAVGLIYFSVYDSGEQSSEPSVERESKQKQPRVRVANAAKSNRFISLKDSSIRWQVRVDQLRRLDASSLSSTEVDYLYSLLRQYPEGHRKEAWWVVVNEVMEQIVKQKIAPERISSELCSIIEDNSLDHVVRDYAVQHISNYLANDVGVNMGDFSEILDSLQAVIEDPANQHNSIPGTTLMGLVAISQNQSQAAAVKVSFAQMASYLRPLIAGTSSASIVTRTSAINAIGLMRVAEYSPVLTELIQSDNTNASVKLSSIAALGDLHGAPNINDDSKNQPEDIQRAQTVGLLQEIASSNTKFRYAATAALKKLQ